MKIVATNQSVHEIQAEACVIGAFSDIADTSEISAINKATDGLITKLGETKEFSGEFGKTISIYFPHNLNTNCLTLVGLGSSTQFDQGRSFRAFATAANALSKKPRKEVAFLFDDDAPRSIVESAIAGIIVGCSGSDLYRTEKKQTPFEQLLVKNASTETLHSGQILGDSINFARHLVNEPPNEVYPFSFAERARASASEVGMEFELWDQGRMQTEDCNALLAVARGSDRLPCLCILRHQGSASVDDPWLALVGKGVTFDSGGLSLKSTEGMKAMKADMAGASTVVAAMQAIAQLRLPVNVMGLVGLVENMPGGRSYKLGDVIRARNGKTIEVLNTDAEGRMVLADVLSVAISQGADRIIDLATLTGACVVALGDEVAGAMTNDQDFCDTLLAAAESCGERVWQLPMFPEYAENLKSQVADIQNIGKGRSGGAITAAKFLEEFVDDVPWVHLDIAGPAFLDKPKGWIDGGGSGVMVRTLVEVAKSWNA